MPTKIVRFLVCTLPLLASAPLWAEPGYQWQTTMEMDGMSIPGMGQGDVQCLPAKEPKNMGMDDNRCKPIESRQTGNRFYWKAKCDGAITTGEFTYLGETAYKGTMTVEEGGEKFVMKMSGKRLGKCEYTPPKMPVFAKPDTTKECDQAVKDLQPFFVFSKSGGMCSNHKKPFCERLRQLTPESFAKVADQVNLESQPDARQSLPPDGRMSDALKQCNLRFADMQSAQCKRAGQAQDYDFMKRYCPAEWQAAKASLCASGRAYTGLCGGGAAASGARAGESRGGSYGGPSQGAGYAGGGTGQGAAPPDDGGTGSGGLGDSLNKLKGLFGF